MPDKERCEKAGKAAIEAAKRMLNTMPDDAKFISGTQVFSGKELKKKFETDEDFALKTVEQVVSLNLDTLIRKQKKDDK